MIITYLLLSVLGVTATQGWSIHIQPSGERLLNRVAGENFLVVCSVKEYDGPASNVQVNWIRDNEVIRAGGRIMTIEKPLSSQLMIVRARKEDSGDYMCQVKLDGQIKVEPAKITFIKAPKFVEPKNEQHPEDGTTAEIECRVDAEPGVEIFWQFNGDTLGESTSRTYDFKENKQILVIPRFDAKKDDGLYLCNAAQFSSFETLHINVTAYSRPSITIFESPKGDLGLEGQQAQFKCAATGKPAPTYKWFKVATHFDDVDYDRQKEDEEIIASDLYTVEDGLLVVNSLAASNSGQYKCVATNEIGEDDKTADLKVFLKPAVEKIANVVKEDGEEVTFTCEFKGEGKVNAKFVFGEEEYQLGGEEEEEANDDDDEETTTNDETEGDDDEKDEKEDKEDKEEDGDDTDDEKKETNTEDKDNEDDDEETTTTADDEDTTDDGDEDDDVAKEMHDAATEDDKEDENDDDKEDNKEEKDENDEDHEHEPHIDHIDAILTPSKEMEDEEVLSTTDASNEIEEDNKDENAVEDKENDEDEDNEEDETTTGDAKDDDEDEAKKWKRFVRDITSERVSIKEDDGVLTLTIRRLTAADAGEYKCIVENDAGKTVRNASLAITHAPEITEHDEEPVRVSDGEDFSLHCVASAVPEPTWTWKRNGVEFEADGTRITIDSDADSTTLTVKDAIKEDAGSIECVASNGVGEPASETMTVVRVVAPSTPSAPNCREHLFPNYGQCTLNDEDFESDEGDATPSQIVFYIATTDEAKEEGFDFKTQARNFTVNYNAAKMRLHGLDVNLGYFVRAMAVNEAGESDLSPQSTIETTDPWAPESPYEVDVKCDTSCEVSWKEPNDHGADITGYKIEVQEMEANEHNEIVPYGDKQEYDVGSDDDSFVLPSMKPNTRYDISVIAANGIGQSSAAQIVVDTPETVSSSLSLESLSSPKYIIIIVVVLFLVFLVIDVLCFLTNKCGVLACCLGRCRSNGHKKSAGTDLESGKAAESGRLLDGPAR